MAALSVLVSFENKNEFVDGGAPFVQAFEGPASDVIGSVLGGGRGGGPDREWSHHQFSLTFQELSYVKGQNTYYLIRNQDKSERNNKKSTGWKVTQLLQEPRRPLYRDTILMCSVSEMITAP
jgi:hypothetical protein